MLFTSLKTEMCALELTLFDPNKGLSSYYNSLLHVGTKIIYVNEALTDDELHEIADYFQNLFFNYLACTCYYGGGLEPGQEPGLEPGQEPGLAPGRILNQRAI